MLTTYSSITYPNLALIKSKLKQIKGSTNQIKPNIILYMKFISPIILICYSKKRICH